MVPGRKRMCGPVKSHVIRDGLKEKANIGGQE